MAKILIVDDEERIREVVKEYAKMEGYECLEADDGLTALEMVQKEDFDLIILDIMMNKLDGFKTCQKIKAEKDVPIIMLSARFEEHDKLYSFEIGVDDYVTKPFSPRELMARAKVVIERHQKNQKEAIKVGDLLIDIKGHDVRLKGSKLNLTPKEVDLLIFLSTHANTAFSREQLLEAVWRYDYMGDERTVDTHIKMLRHNLGEYRDHILTVRGMGYKFED